MQTEELKVSKKLFPKKKVHITDNYLELETNIAKLLNKNEEVIIGYLERFIYTSSLSETTKAQLQTIFDNTTNKIITKK
jgi:hypothetical protein